MPSSRPTRRQLLPDLTAATSIKRAYGDDDGDTTGLERSRRGSSVAAEFDDVLVSLERNVNIPPAPAPDFTIHTQTANASDQVNCSNVLRLGQTPAPVLSIETATPPPKTLAAQHIMLARIPGSAPLSRQRIQTACKFFEELLTDGSPIEVMEIKDGLGVRIYHTEDLPEYNRLKKEAAAKHARQQAMELAEALDTAIFKQTVADSDAKVVINQNGSAKADNDHAITEGASKNFLGETPLTVPRGQPQADFTANEFYDGLRFKVKPTFVGNQHYTADGRPKNSAAQARLVVRAEAGSEDVVRDF